MPAHLELRYLRDDSRWALDAVLRRSGQVVGRSGRLFLEEPGAERVAAAVARFAAAYEQGLQAGDRAGAILTQATGVTDALRRQVIPAAEQLGAALLPPEIHPWLSASPAPRIEVVCDADLLHVPFEAAWWHGDFLGFRFPVARRLITRRQGYRPRLKVSTPPRCAVVSDPGALLNPDGRRSSGATVKELLSRLRDGWTDASERRIELPPSSCRFSEPTTAEQLNALLAGHDIFILLAHHEADRRDPQSRELLGPGRGVQIAPDRFYSGADLLRAMAPNGRAPWLLCWPCCESGTSESWQREWRQADAAGPAASLADAALQLGIPNFIGTVFQVHAEFVAHFIEPLLVALDEGHGLPEALRRARGGLRGLEHAADPFHPGTLPGLALVLLGDASSALLSAGGRRVDHDHPEPPNLAWCGEPTVDGLCGRVVASGEPGHARRRCAQHQVETDAKLECCSAGHAVPSSQLATCGQPGCAATYCPRCGTHRHQRCWQHAGEGGLIRFPSEGTRCSDPFGLHSLEPRMVHWQEPGFTHALCGACWRERKQRVQRALHPT